MLDCDPVVLVKEDFFDFKISLFGNDTWLTDVSTNFKIKNILAKR